MLRRNSNIKYLTDFKTLEFNDYTAKGYSKQFALTRKRHANIPQCFDNWISRNHVLIIFKKNYCVYGTRSTKRTILYNERTSTNELVVKTRRETLDASRPRGAPFWTEATRMAYLSLFREEPTRGARRIMTVSTHYYRSKPTSSPVVVSTKKQAKKIYATLRSIQSFLFYIPTVVCTVEWTVQYVPVLYS